MSKHNTFFGNVLVQIKKDLEEGKWNFDNSGKRISQKGKEKKRQRSWRRLK